MTEFNEVLCFFGAGTFYVLGTGNIEVGMIYYIKLLVKILVRVHKCC